MHVAVCLRVFFCGKRFQCGIKRDNVFRYFALGRRDVDRGLLSTNGPMIIAAVDLEKSWISCFLPLSYSASSWPQTCWGGLPEADEVVGDAHGCLMSDINAKFVAIEHGFSIGI